MKAFYIVEWTDEQPQWVYFTSKREALKSGRAHKDAQDVGVSRITLTKDALIRLLNQEAGFVASSEVIWTPETDAKQP